MALKLTIVAAALAILGSALAWQRAPEQAAPTTTDTQASTAVANTSYAKLLDELDQRIDSLTGRATDRPNDWLTRMHLGTALLDRAGLTNQVDDFERVQAVLDEAFAIAPQGSGPLLLAARFNFSIHRLDVAEQYLDRMDAQALRKGGDQLVARMMRAQIALQRGQYELAFAGLTQVAEAQPAVATAELALYHAKTGDPERADALLEEALATTSKRDPRRRAWTIMQRGLIALDHGAYLQALERLREADAELPGWWLVQEHIAEVHDRLGQHRQAIAIYEELVRTGGLAQHMDALATVYQHAGEPAQASEFVARAGAAWDELLERMPAAAMGHGLEHQLQHGTPARALELALANYAMRPGGEAQVALARAYLAVGRASDALALAEQALATPYRTAGLHDVAARAHAALGHTAQAEEQRALCTATNPTFQGDEHTH